MTIDDKAARAGDDAAAALKTAARVALDAADHRRALSYLRALELIAPETDVLLNIGVCHYQLGEHEAAVDAFGRLLADQPTHEKALNNLAVVSAKLGRIEIRDEGRTSAVTWNAVALESYYRGNFKLARKLFDLAIETDPAYISAYYNMGDLIGDDELDDWVERVAALSPKSRPDQVAHAFLLADLQERRGDIEAAAALYARGNRLHGAENAGRFDIERHEALCRSIIDWFTPERVEQLGARLSGLDLDRRRIVFVVGLPRSASTLASRVLAADPSVVDLGEVVYLVGCVNAAVKPHPGGFPRALGAFSDGDWQAMQADYFNRVGYPGRVVVDKYLESFLFAGLIPHLFPGARIVHCVRNREDTLLSCYKHLFPIGVFWSCDLENIKRYDAAYRRLMAHWKAVLPAGTIHDLVYENLVADPEGQRAALLEFCGLSADAADSAFHERPAVVQTASAKQVREPIHGGRVGSYAAYRPYLSFD